MRPIVAAESVTALGPAVRGAVLVAGSHGGLIASYLGARAGAHALILNDAGVGLDGAGIAGLAYLEAIGMAAATVAHTSARIGATGGRSRRDFSRRGHRYRWCGRHALAGPCRGGGPGDHSWNSGAGRRGPTSAGLTPSVRNLYNPKVFLPLA